MQGKETRGQRQRPGWRTSYSRKHLATTGLKAGVVQTHGLVPLSNLAINTSGDPEYPRQAFDPMHALSDVIVG